MLFTTTKLNSVYQGGEVSEAAADAPAAPPHVPDNALTASSKPAAAAPGGGGGFLAQLNQGAAVTSGLKKVDASEMTHKNPALRAGSVVSDAGGWLLAGGPGRWLGLD